MARRLAAAAGYGLQTGFLAVPHAESGVSQAGRVVKQIPAPGDASAPGSIITVLLGKEE
jgi:beta-lactam-binding protein with PASTA domain